MRLQGLYSELLELLSRNEELHLAKDKSPPFMVQQFKCELLK
ncbi:MAG: hypothetical protein BAJALOKI1v1_1000014 [Promethearchaeota archaeon]|nr:MAG: hypothetical protein BAJALOKI1v1_1000014 [Candidatus Lokiarchaeota archaeon]